MIQVRELEPVSEDHKIHEVRPVRRPLHSSIINKGKYSDRRNNSYKLSASQKSINITQLRDCFESFTIIDYNEFDHDTDYDASKQDDIETTAQENHKDASVLQGTCNKIMIRHDSKNQVDSYNLLKQYNLNIIWENNKLKFLVPLSDVLLPLLAPKSTPVDDILSLNSLTISKTSYHKSATKFIVKKSLTVNDYNRLSINLKFKICLNFIRFNIFKKISYSKSSVSCKERAIYEETLDTTSLNNIKNVFFYQIFKRFEEYYKLNNKLINYLNISMENKLKVIEVVEKVYLNNWNLNGCMKLEEHLLSDIY